MASSGRSLRQSSTSPSGRTHPPQHKASDKPRPGTPIDDSNEPPLPAWIRHRIEENFRRVGYGPPPRLPRPHPPIIPEPCASGETKMHDASTSKSTTRDSQPQPSPDTSQSSRTEPFVSAHDLFVPEDEEITTDKSKRKVTDTDGTRSVSSTVHNSRGRGRGLARGRARGPRTQPDLLTRQDVTKRKAEQDSRRQTLYQTPQDQDNSSAVLKSAPKGPKAMKTSREGNKKEITSTTNKAEAIRRAPNITPAKSDIPKDVQEERAIRSTLEKFRTRDLPEWYTCIKDSGFTMNELAKKRPKALVALGSLKECIEKCEASTEFRSLMYLELRDHIHTAEFLELNQYIVKKSKILVEQIGLPRIFTGSFPHDLRADSYQLYVRWLRQDFGRDILRGIAPVKGEHRNGDQIDPSYKLNNPTNAKSFGQGELVNGQWWPTQLCTVRDGAHGCTQGGISGNKSEGAYSIILSASRYHDKDEGNIIEYCGTDGTNFTPTDATLSMIKSAETGNPIRVIRSSKAKGQYRPEVGFRYDGLYVIKNSRCLNLEKQIMCFRLERVPGQSQIRCRDDGSRRPTRWEKMAYDEIKERW